MMNTDGLVGEDRREVRAAGADRARAARGWPVVPAAEVPGVAGDDVDLRPRARGSRSCSARKSGAHRSSLSSSAMTVAATRRGAPCCAPPERPPFGLLHEPDARIARRAVPPTISARRVGRAVVDDDQLESVNVWARTEPIAAPTYGATLYAGMITLTAGIATSSRRGPPAAASSSMSLVERVDRSSASRRRAGRRGRRRRRAAVALRSVRDPPGRARRRPARPPRRRPTPRPRRAARRSRDGCSPAAISDGPVDADDRPVAQQELEAGRAVVGDHQVGRDEVREMSWPGAITPRPGARQRLRAAPPSRRRPSSARAGRAIGRAA